MNSISELNRVNGNCSVSSPAAAAEHRAEKSFIRERQPPAFEMGSDRKQAPADRLVQELFEEQVERTPDAIALLSTEGQLTYRQLNENANQLAHYLRGLGVGPEVMIGLCVERSFRMVIAMLGILKAGGAYVPLDPQYPQERLAYMIRDAQLPVLLTERRLATCLAPGAARVISLDADSAAIAAFPKDNPACITTTKNLAYVIYTSGSTGRPKGVLLQHSGLCNLAAAQARAFCMDEQSRVLQFASLSFDASVSEVFKTLLAGAQLFVSSSNLPLAGPDLSRLLREQEITVVTLPPSVLSTLAADELPALQTLIVAGEACPAELPRRWAAGRRFFNAYGPTEITVCATIARCAAGGEKPPIGLPLENTEVHIFAADLCPSPVGAAGELYLGGIGIARGYHGRPELTAERFTPNPFSTAEPGARLYRTGDRARCLPDGQLEFLGRIDHQVKVRGFRIELGEIEYSLSAHQSVRECIVLALDDVRAEKQLVAYLVPEPGTQPTSGELRRHLQQSLPDFMLPAAFVTLDQMPLTPNGKIDRLALPALASVRTLDDMGLTAAPRTLLEKLIARLWMEVLGVEQVGTNDNFFEIGGESLKAAIFLNRLQEELGEVVYVVALFDAPTIAELAAYLQQHYRQAVARFNGEPESATTERGSGLIGAAQLDYIRRLIKPLPPYSTNRGTKPAKNPRAIFILSPPRSGSTLLRVMLAGSPALFAPPELQLLSFNTLQDRKAIFTGRYSFWLEGTIRALMDTEGQGADAAARLMAECEARAMPTQEFYRLLQSRIPDKWLVDKTPAYALDSETLKRAEDYFTDALYIHLLRHPRGMIRSFADAKLDQIFRYEHPYSTRELAECIWTISHQNITAFLQSVPAQRQHRVRFEELVKQPEETLGRLSRFLGIEFHSAMAQPHREQEKKMTDGIHGLSRMLGDIKFHTHQSIDAKIAERWKEQSEPDFLGEITRNLATVLGYDMPAQSPLTVSGAVQPRSLNVLSPLTALPRLSRQSTRP